MFSETCMAENYVYHCRFKSTFGAIPTFYTQTESYYMAKVLFQLKNRQAGAELCQAQSKLGQLNQLQSAMLTYILASYLPASLLAYACLLSRQLCQSAFQPAIQPFSPVLSPPIHCHYPYSGQARLSLVGLEFDSELFWGRGPIIFLLQIPSSQFKLSLIGEYELPILLF